MTSISLWVGQLSERFITSDNLRANPLAQIADWKLASDEAELKGEAYLSPTSGFFEWRVVYCSTACRSWIHSARGNL